MTKVQISCSPHTAEDERRMKDCVEMLRQMLCEAQAELEELNERLSVKGDYRFGRGDPSIYQWEMTLARRKRVQQRVDSIEEALRRIKTGEYGICEQCGGRIQIERLEILPFTNLCVECARGRG